MRSSLAHTLPGGAIDVIDSAEINHGHPEVNVKTIKLNFRIMSDLLARNEPSEDPSTEDPPYTGTPPTRPSAPPPVCNDPPAKVVTPYEMWYVIEQLYDKHYIRDRRSGMGQLELQAVNAWITASTVRANIGGTSTYFGVCSELNVESRPASVTYESFTAMSTKSGNRCSKPKLGESLR